MDNAYFIDINSADRNAGGTVSNFTFNIALPTDGRTFNRVSVTSVTCTKSNYAIQALYNYFYLIENGVRRTITITPGNYILNAFKTVLQTQMNASAPSGWVYAVTFPNTSIAANTGKFTYTVTGNSGSQPSIQVLNFMYRKLGFDKNSTNVFVSDTITSTNVLFLNATPSLYIKSNLVDGETSQLVRVDASLVPDYGTITYQCPHPESFGHMLSSSTSNTASFSMTNQDNLPIDLNGNDWIISLAFWKADDTMSIIRTFIEWLTNKLSPKQKSNASQKQD
jgi:hypothetical protein